ncbi:hypothetical protein [Yinghuangia sp. YIM S09857]|uniref:hypothetical protein n=1 Tax=Yinghuangia sp. YIM S09857 TaxID=3436929 RepID=UPI003F53E410
MAADCATATLMGEDATHRLLEVATMLVLTALGLIVLTLGCTALFVSACGRLRRREFPRWTKRGKPERRGYVWQDARVSAEADAERVSLEHSEQALAAARLTGTLDCLGYHDEMSRVAALDDEQRPVRVPTGRRHP